MKKTLKNISGLFYSKSTILAFLLLVTVTSIVFRDQNFLSVPNMMNMLLKAAKNGGFLALGMTFVILCGEIDLSVGAVFALSGVVMGLTGRVNPFLGLLCGLLVGVVSGLMIGFMVTKMRISSWIASLAMLFALRGVILIVADKSVVIEGSVLTFAGAKILPGVLPGMNSGISILIPMLFIITFLCMYLSRHTRFGMGMYAVGGNGEAARMMGINVEKIKIKAFVASGFIAALSGGEGKFSGAFFGILIYFIINTIFTYLPSGISVHWQSIIMGALVLISVGVQSEALQELRLQKRHTPHKASR
ncbi:MAG: ABC transporter permease [Pygmaiobacter sp.]|nr:ABC transporter permease [Pygmaiobacter sp.]